MQTATAFLLRPRCRSPPFPVRFAPSPKIERRNEQVKNYTDNDYALNKNSAGIVYRFADGTKFTYTLADYLAENRGKTEDDFRVLKELSDSDYFQTDRAGNAQTKKNAPLDELSGSMKCAPSPEDLHIGGIEAREESERHNRQTELSRRALALLTDTQRRRYLLYHVDGKTLRCIAGMEGVGFTKIQKSIESAEKKIRKFLSQA
jgi:DNA-directed RNA polymerase specialized sigma24 family protein